MSQRNATAGVASTESIEAIKRFDSSIHTLYCDVSMTPYSLPIPNHTMDSHLHSQGPLEAMQHGSAGVHGSCQLLFMG